MNTFQKIIAWIVSFIMGIIVFAIELPVKIILFLLMTAMYIIFAFLAPITKNIKNDFLNWLRDYSWNKRFRYTGRITRYYFNILAN